MRELGTGRYTRSGLYEDRCPANADCAIIVTDDEVTVERDGLNFAEQHDGTDSDVRYAMGFALEGLDDALFRAQRGRR